VKNYIISRSLNDDILLIRIVKLDFAASEVITTISNSRRTLQLILLQLNLIK